MSEKQPPQVGQGISKWMVVLAWVAGLALMAMIFQDLLEKQFNPNQTPSSTMSQSGAEVRLQQNRMGHYVTSGEINGQPVVFLLDTGATSVSVPYHLAGELGLQQGRRFPVSTANGTVTVAHTSIEQLRIGDITLYDVDANLNPGMRDDKILLGMSALKQLEFSQRGEWLVLRNY
ncbi:retropepsin-like aspartic protease family protein [Aestuariibacter salexigens]|uniref:retropepsin-like aspartic protease family protein n=1 Tax=Aestuariibacter salexigens TaxID=226010 RepID=UPI00047EDA43|nr:TIGR02281 family clan AA aspartic protease [Aestuariibacter salexigens]